ncbi:MAG TPA: adenylosuccinate lyase [Actinomycetota bacterium]|nr:adenylosuccinate lyase [Actinomycetota bacterium]
MIDRYTRPEMAAVWSEEVRLGHWLRIEILGVEARVAKGEVPAADLAEIKDKAGFDPVRIAEIEQRTRHDVAAFLDNVAEIIGPAARHIHYGMTSSDILDTALALQLVAAADLLLTGLMAVRNTTIALARRYVDAVAVGRTHGIHAEPVTFGLKAAGWAFELERGRTRLLAARSEVAVGKLSGAVGTYSQLPPDIEEFVCDRLGLTPDPSSTQVISRDRHASFAAALGIAAASIERIFTEIRHLARTEVREVEEPFAEGAQKGSSAMPHKRNPWRSERLCGLARVVRAGVVPAMEDVALWHERDISHSSVERVMLPDACIALDFMLAEATELLGGLRVYPERMLANLEASGGVVFSQSVLLALIDAGMTRDEAYRIVQECSMEAWATGTHLRQLLKASPAAKRLDEAGIDDCFDPSRYLRHARTIVDRLASLEGAP